MIDNTGLSNQRIHAQYLLLTHALFILKTYNQQGVVSDQ